MIVVANVLILLGSTAILLIHSAFQDLSSLQRSEFDTEKSGGAERVEFHPPAKWRRMRMLQGRKHRRNLFQQGGLSKGLVKKWRVYRKNSTMQEGIICIPRGIENFCLRVPPKHLLS